MRTHHYVCITHKSNDSCQFTFSSIRHDNKPIFVFLGCLLHIRSSKARLSNRIMMIVMWNINSTAPVDRWYEFWIVCKRFHWNICWSFQGGKHIVEFQGTVYSGEAPESDDEIPSISNVKIGKEVTEVFQSPSAPPVRPQFFETQSVLQKLLGENMNAIRILEQHTNFVRVISFSWTQSAFLASFKSNCPEHRGDGFE